GAIALPVVLVVVFALFFFAGRSSRRVRPRALEGMAAADPAALEAQAMALYNAAVQYYRAGKVEETSSTLQQVITLFPLTVGGNQARQALDRMSRGEDPFDNAPSKDTASPPLSAPTENPPSEDPPKKKSFIGIRSTQPSTES